MNAHRKIASDLAGLVRQVEPLSRRGFFMTGSAAVAAGYTLAAGPVRADPIKTDTIGIQAGDKKKVSVADGRMPVYFATPNNNPNPPVILVAMEVFGLHEYIRDVTRRLAKLGALAVAPDYYFRNGDLTKVSEQAKLMPLVNAKTDAELFADLDATVEWAKAAGGDTARLGMIGFCRGGRNVWHYATHNAGLKAAVSFYGSLADTSPAAPKSSLDLAPEVKVPVLGLYGEADGGIPVTQVKDMEDKLKTAGKTAELRIYPGAPHGFHADYRASYREDAAKAAWGEMIEWFKKYRVL